MRAEDYRLLSLLMAGLVSWKQVCCAGVLGASDEMAAVVVRVESQELLVDLVEHAGNTYPSTLSPVAQTGQGAQVALQLHPFLGTATSFLRS